MTKTPTPMCDRLAAGADERRAITDFLEWLGAQHIHLQQWSTGLTDEVECYGRGGWLDECPGTDCAACGGSGRRTVELRDRYLPVAQSHEDLVMSFLGIDTDALEHERRALLEGLRDA